MNQLPRSRSRLPHDQAGRRSWSESMSIRSRFSTGHFGGRPWRGTSVRQSMGGGSTRSVRIRDVRRHSFAPGTRQRKRHERLTGKPVCARADGSAHGRTAASIPGVRLPASRPHRHDVRHTRRVDESTNTGVRD